MRAAGDLVPDLSNFGRVELGDCRTRKIAPNVLIGRFAQGRDLLAVLMQSRDTSAEPLDVADTEREAVLRIANEFRYAARQRSYERHAALRHCLEQRYRHAFRFRGQQEQIAGLQMPSNLAPVAPPKEHDRSPSDERLEFAFQIL